MTLMATKKPPTICPECGFDLKSDGYPLAHRTAEGAACDYRWAPADPEEWADLDGEND